MSLVAHPLIASTSERQAVARLIATYFLLHLREEMLKLQKDNQRLGKELDEVKKRLDAGAPKPSGTNAPAPGTK